MKTKSLILTLCLMLITAISYSQETKSTEVNGVTVYNLDIKIPKTKEQQIGKSKLTENKAVYKKEEYSVYMTEKGKLFIVYPNKDNTRYNKKYIK